MLSWLWIRGWRRGVIGGSPWWTVVATIAAMVKLNRWLESRHEVVFREEVKPGQGLIITRVPPAAKM